MHHQKIEKVFQALKTSPQGFTSEEAAARLQHYGLNELKEEKKVRPLAIFFSQFKSPLIYLLLFATLISLFISEYLNAAVIGSIIILNTFLGFFQEFRAEKALAALKKMISLKAKVIRQGKETLLDASYLVPGDILVLEEGSRLPADARLFEVYELKTQEAALTGESLPVKKDLKILPEKTPLADRRNMVYSGTLVASGRGKAVITYTGMQTEFGRIAHLLQQAKEELTPLQKKLKALGQYLTLAVVVLAFIIFLAGLFTGQAFSFMLLTSVALAVAAIPEGLPAVVTISLALGVQRLVKRHALIRKLPSVETLGVVNVICTDKTGTLTHNQMTVTQLWANNQIYEVTGSGYQKKGTFLLNRQPADSQPLETLLRCGSLCNNATIKEKGSQREVIGDPTEAALIVSAEKAGYPSASLHQQFPRINEIPFSSERKRMTTFHQYKNKKISFTKGAPDIIIRLCNRLLINNKLERLTSQKKKELLKQNEEFARQALRVLAFAYNDKTKNPEKGMIFLGLQAMIDPPREEVKDSLQRCQEAGIRVIMITGDHLTTARAIAHQLGLTGQAIEGKDLTKINLKKEIEKISIFARVNPKDKIKIVEALKHKKYIVAMTGDGVNDAPALKKADIGIAMGITGTDVAKEASGLILIDDNFTSIVNAVEEGRHIFDNIKKFVVYLLSSNSGEVLTIFFALLLGLPLPLLAVQILWINLITDGAPATALSLEPSEPRLMQRPPLQSRTAFLTKPNLFWILAVGFIMALGTLALFFYALKTNGWAGELIDFKNPPSYYLYATTLAFTTLMMFQVFNVINCKTLKASVFRAGLFSNKWLIGALIFSILLQLIVVYLPSFNTLFHTTPLSLMDWLLLTLVSSSVLWLGEIIKLVKRDKNEE